jgi:16S rRNA (cytidine1402-2'-O)-methyltransferase
MNIQKTKIVPALYIVSTPIGNLGDISKRQQEILSGSDYILCEDTRVTSKLLNFLNIKKKLISYHSFNEKNKTDNLINDLKENKILSLVSDAGTPALSDPGQIIISKCHDQGIKVIPIPGPSAITASMSASGFADNFYFCGFIPKKNKEIENYLLKLKPIKACLVFFMPARDLRKNSEYLIKFFTKTKFFLAREITKVHETYIRGDTKNISNYIDENDKGEMTLIIDNSVEELSQNIDLDKEIELLIGKMSSKDIAEYLSKKLEINKKSIYQRVIDLND